MEKQPVNCKKCGEGTFNADVENTDDCRFLRLTCTKCYQVISLTLEYNKDDDYV